MRPPWRLTSADSVSAKFIARFGLIADERGNLEVGVKTTNTRNLQDSTPLSASSLR